MEIDLSFLRSKGAEHHEHTCDRAKSTGTRTRAFVIAWAFTVVLYFLEYAVRSCPAEDGSRVGILISHDDARRRRDSRDKTR
jgi:hypothetical protein